MCKRLRARYNSESSFAELSKDDMMVFGEHTPMAMDFVERSHNHMSTDIGVSQGPGRNFTNSVARVACREMKEAHVARGGVDFTSSESLTRALGCGGGMVNDRD